MLMTPDEYERVLARYYLFDCVVRDRDKLAFLADRSYTDEEVEVEEEGMLDPFLRDKRVVTLFRNRPEETRWSHHDLKGWAMLRAGSSTVPHNQVVVVDTGGHVFATGAGFGGRESDIGRAKVGGPKRGAMTRLRNIGGYAFACGTGRSVARRLGKDHWQSFTQSIPEAAADSDDGFEDIDGFDVDSLYAVGGKGDVWRYDGNIWMRCAFPTNTWVQSVCCAGDGNVYVSCYEGLTFAGSKDSWRELYAGGIALGFKDMVWYEDMVWCTNDNGIWTFEDGHLSRPDLPSEIRVCAGNLSVGDGVLLVAGPAGAAFKEGGRWTSILLRPELELAIAERSHPQP